MRAKCLDPFKKICNTWGTLDETARIEVVCQTITEICAGKKVSQICDKFNKKVIEKATPLIAGTKLGKAVDAFAKDAGHAKLIRTEGANGFVDKAAKVGKKTIAPGVVQDINGVIEVANMPSFFKHVPFGKQLKNKCRPLKKFYDKERMYEVVEEVQGTSLKKGDIFYLDPGAEKNHLEVYTSLGKSKDVINLDGTVNEAKAKIARDEGRRIKL